MALFLVLFFCFSRIFASPLQRPLISGEDLDWTAAECSSSFSENGIGNNTICVQKVWDPVIDGDINGAPVNNQFCGYMIPAGTGKNPVKLFFWVVMSETDPTKDPVVLWMNGGPGSSSLYGLFNQWGPRIINRARTDAVVFMTNQFRMTEKLTWVFLEQPSGVGYSRGRANVKDSQTAAIDISTFISTLFLPSTKFKLNVNQVSFAGRDFHIAGESYAGHWIPAIGSYLVNKKKLANINLKSFLIGNPWTDAALAGEATYKLLCGPAPFLTLPGSTPATIQSNCSQMPQWISDCKAAIQECRRPGKKPPCVYYGACQDAWSETWADKFGRNVYDANEDQASLDARNLFFKDKWTPFMNERTRKIRFGVPTSVTWHLGNQAMMTRFDRSGDQVKSFIPEVQDILNAGFDFLFYAGDQDLICPFTLVKDTALNTVWTETDPDPSLGTKTAKFQKCAARAETTYKKLSSPSSPGYASYIRAGRLSYARVFGAGHMVNEKKPAEAKHMFENWIFNRAMFQECDPGP
ncbi:alpha/beta-hydrolase [Cadophora sp. DSE1049]|nr:alpha/beta-hydrolase [Cadophora sp. DSE1049]